MYLVMWVFMYNLLSGICLSMFFVGALSHTLQIFSAIGMDIDNGEHAQ